MASVEEEDVIDDEHLNAVLAFPPEVQEAIDQVSDIYDNSTKTRQGGHMISQRVTDLCQIWDRSEMG